VARALLVACLIAALAATPAQAARLEVVLEYGSVADGAAHAAAADDSCRNREWHPTGFANGPAWAARGYTYFANLSRMPHGDRDRRQITKGKHTWDNTRNGCGYKDITNFRSRYGGRTKATVHSRRDGLNVVDFGSLARFTRDRFAIAVTFTWWENGHLVETDSRFEQPPSTPAGTLSWSVSGKPEVNRWDLWSMAAHESGHAAGLGHATTSTDNWLTMSPLLYTNSVRWRTLGRGDVVGLRALFP